MDVKTWEKEGRFLFFLARTSRPCEVKLDGSILVAVHRLQRSNDNIVRIEPHASYNLWRDTHVDWASPDRQWIARPAALLVWSVRIAPKGAPVEIVVITHLGAVDPAVMRRTGRHQLAVTARSADLINRPKRSPIPPTLLIRRNQKQIRRETSGISYLDRARTPYISYLEGLR